MNAGAVAAAGPWRIHGQEHAVGALRAALDHDRLSHAYLLTGPEGVGKATLARRLVQSLLCEQPDGTDPCLACRSCQRVETGEAPDIEVVAIGGPCADESHRDHTADGSTRIRICQVRRLARLSSLSPYHAARRVFIVDTADDLQTEAAHALLKTLEEPPASALLLLLSANPEELLPTIRSRCQVVALRPMGRAELAAALVEAEGLDGAEAAALASLAQGRYGLAVRLHRDPSLRSLYEAASADLRGLLRSARNERLDYSERLAGGWRRDRRSVLDTLDVWLRWWREVLGRNAGTEDDAGAFDDGPVAEAAALSPREIVTALRATQRARQHLLENTNPQLALDVLMLDLPELPPEEDGRTLATTHEDDRSAAAPPA